MSKKHKTPVFRVAAHKLVAPVAGLSRFHYQRGVSLVELMVGLAIGMLVVMAALSSVLFTRMSARSLSDSAQLEQQATVVMNMLGQQFKQAGAFNAVAFNTAGGTGAVVFDQRSYVGLMASNPGLVRVQGTDGTGSAADTVTLSYEQPNDGSFAGNCIGQGAISFPPNGSPSSQQIVSQLSVSTSSRSLLCGSAGQLQPIAANVEDMQVFYLTQLPGSFKIMRQTATELGNNAAAWAGVDAVEICLHMTGDETKSRGSDFQQTFVDCKGQSVTTNQNDLRVHRVIRQTFQLRNTGAA